MPEDFPVHNRQFIGCMRNLSIDSKPIDMASFIANNGTLPGMSNYRLKSQHKKALCCSCVCVTGLRMSKGPALGGTQEGAGDRGV